VPSPSRAFRPLRKSAFSLIELLTVFGLVALLGGLAIGTVYGARQRANIARACSALATLSAALEEFRRHYGDYPQLGGFPQAAATPSPPGAGPGVGTAQARLYNCLTGVFGPQPHSGNAGPGGPNFLDGAKIPLDAALSAESSAPRELSDAAPSPREQNACLLDPWGRRYFYYYKDARVPGRWQAAGYMLYSTGARLGAGGVEVPPFAPTTGLMLPEASADAADNLYAHP